MTDPNISTFSEKSHKWKTAIEKKVDSEIDKHNVDPNSHQTLFAQKSKVSFTRALDSGTEIGSITIDGITTKLYCETDTDTTYGIATTNSNGLMSYGDKVKLDGISNSADAVSFNALLTSGTKLGTITINGVSTDLYCETDTDTIYTNATTSADGLMSKEDKTKLNGITDSADAVGISQELSSGTKIATITINGVDTDLYCETNTDTVYVHPTYTARTGKPDSNKTPGFGDTVTVSQITSDSTGHVTAVNDKTIKIPDTEASTSAHGLMSSADKIKLDGIANEANKTIIDNSLSDSSTNPVQNKVINTALNGKANSSHTHSYSQIDRTDTGSTNIDFNTYKTQGLFYIWWADQQNNTNRPAACGGLLRVGFIPNGVEQTFFCYGANNNTIFYRTYYSPSNTWNGWIRIDGQDKANSVHTHDDRYYTESETDTKLTTKDVTLTKLETATTGYVATYEIKQGGTSLGKIDIPKDYLVKSGSVKTVTTANSPVSGYVVGDKYIDFVINTKTSDGTDEHLYVNTKDFIDNATQSRSGLMSAADKTKLDNIATGANAYSHPSTHPATMITDANAHSNIGSAANANQGVINTAIDTALSGKLSSASGQVRESNLASNAVTESKIKDGSVTNSKLAGTRILASESSIIDLNDSTYQKTGIYYCANDSEAKYVIHCPWSNGTATPYTGNKGFFLLVEDWGESNYSCKQTLTYYNGNNTFTRTKTNSTTWTGWKELNTNNNDYLRVATRVISGESAQIPANRIIAGCTDSKYHIVVSGLTLDTKYPILFNTSAINTGSYTDNTYISHTGVGLTGNVSGLTVTSQRPIYIEGTFYDGRRFEVSNKVFVSDDNLTLGNYYIYIGSSYSTTAIRFNSFHQTVYVKSRDGLVPVGDNTHNPHMLIKSDAGDAGYFKFLTIRVTGTYHDHTIEFDATHRGNRPKTVVSFNFETWSSNSIYYTRMQAFYYHGHPTPVYYVQTNNAEKDATFDFYIRRETWDEIGISDLRSSIDNYNAMTITWHNEFVTSLPSGAVQAAINPYYKDTNTTYTADNSTLELSGTQFKVKDGGITSAKIADSTIVNGDIANTTIQGGKLVNGTITATQLASNAVETAKIKDGAVTNEKLSSTRLTASSSSILDLNTIVKTGFYHCEQDSYAPYIIHCPNSNGTATPYSNNKAFFLLVEDWTTNGYSCKQTLTYYNDNNTYVRTKTNTTTWTNWKRFDTNTIERVQQTGNIEAGEALTAYGLVCAKSDGKYYKIAPNVELDTNHLIFWPGGNFAVDGVSNNVYNVYPDINLTQTKSGATVTANRRVFIEGSAFNKNKFTISSTVFRSEDALQNNCYYIPIGMSRSTTQIRFNIFDIIVYKYTTVNGLVPVGLSYNDLLDKPSSFSPSSHTHKNLEKTEITSGSLDTITTTGWYSYSNANSNNITNVPEKVASMMEVLDDYGDGDYVVQKVYVLETDKNPRVYYREKYATNGWGQWKRISNWGENPLTLAQGTTSAFTASLASLPEYYHGLTINILNWKGNNVANATLAINGLAAKPIIYKYRNIQADEWLYGHIGTFIYVGSEWTAFNSGNGAWLLIDPGNSSDPKFNHIGATSSSTKDLNNYKTGGFYYCDSNANEAPYISNCPLTSTNNKAFFLLVETWGMTSSYVKQTLTYYHNNETYIRTCDYNTWKEWRRVDTNGDYQSPNLLPNTKNFSEPAPSGSSINGEYNGCKVRYLKNTTSNYIDFTWQIPQELLKPNTYYTLSFWAKTTTAHQNCIAYLYNGNNQTTLRQWSNSTVSGQNTPVTSVHDGGTTFALTTGWKRYTVTWFLNSTAISTTKNLLIRLTANTSANPDIYLAGVKFEEGYTQTAYSEYENENLGAECVWSTHSSSTSAWTGTCVTTKSIKKGTVIYYALRQAPATSNVTLTLTMPNGKTHTGDVYVNSVRLTNQYPQYSMIGLVWEGTVWKCINNYTNTTYTAGTGLNLSGTSFSVKLNQQTNSTSTTEAATPSAVKAAYDLANGKANASHTHPDTQINWNGTALAGEVSPIDTAMYEEFNANRLAGFPGDYITIEYSTDGGSTWTAHTDSADEKKKLATTSKQYSCGNGSTTDYSKNQLRITFKLGDTDTTSKLYMVTRKAMLYLCTCGAANPKCQISYSTYKTPTTFTNIGGNNAVSGWSGWNSIPLSLTLGGFAGDQTNSSSTRPQYLRFTFTQTGGTGNMSVSKIRLFGETAWVTSSQMANSGHPYVYDQNGVVTFINNVWTNGKFVKNGGTSAQFLKANGDVDGNVYIHTAGTNLSKSNNTLNHAASGVGAKSNGLYKTTIDAQGHITAATAVTIDSSPANNANNLVSSQGVYNALAGKAPTSHASTATTYGVSSDTNYGHAMASSTTPLVNGAAAVGNETSKFARGNHVHPITTPIPANSDLNSYRTTGFYWCNWDGASTSIKNQPRTSGQLSFFLVVEALNTTSNWAKQTLTYYNDSSTYVRVCNNGTWSGWTNITNNFSTYVDDNFYLYTEAPSYDRTYTQGEGIGDLLPMSSSKPFSELTTSSAGLKMNSSQSGTEKGFFFPVVNPTSLEFTYVSGTCRGFYIGNSTNPSYFWGYQDGTGWGVQNTIVTANTVTKTTTAIAANDRIKIAIESGKVNVYRNGTQELSCTIGTALDGVTEYYIGFYTNYNRNLVVKDITIK